MSEDEAKKQSIIVSITRMTQFFQSLSDEQFESIVNILNEEQSAVFISILDELVDE